MAKEICYVCGQKMSQFDIYDPESGEKVAEEIACPDEWRESHNRAKGGY
jgi:hypothetical protein